MFKLLLSAYGYQVFTAENGEEGLRLFKEKNPQIIFTDLKMPGLDGLEVLQQIHDSRIQKNGKDTENPNNGKKTKTGTIDGASTHCQSPQVIVITGHGDMDKALDALDLDASDFINKPVEKQALDDALKRAESRMRSGRTALHVPTLSFRKMEKTLMVEVAGRLTATPSVQQQLTDSQTPEFLEGIETLSFHLDDTFSIDRGGIAMLMHFMARIRQSGITITMKGLSYNYIQLFKMAGFHESATLIQDRIDA